MSELLTANRAVFKAIHSPEETIPEELLIDYVDNKERLTESERQQVASLISSSNAVKEEYDKHIKCKDYG